MAKNNIAQIEQLFKEQDYRIQDLELSVQRVAVINDRLRGICRELIYINQREYSV